MSTYLHVAVDAVFSWINNNVTTVLSSTTSVFRRSSSREKNVLVNVIEKLLEMLIP